MNPAVERAVIAAVLGELARELQRAEKCRVEYRPIVVAGTVEPYLRQHAVPLSAYASDRTPERGGKLALHIIRRLSEPDERTADTQFHLHGPCRKDDITPDLRALGLALPRIDTCTTPSTVFLKGGRELQHVVAPEIFHLRSQMSIMYLAVPYMHLAAVGKYLYVSAPAVTVAAGLKVEYGLAVGRIADTEKRRARRGRQLGCYAFTAIGHPIIVGAGHLVGTVECRAPLVGRNLKDPALRHKRHEPIVTHPDGRLMRGHETYRRRIGMVVHGT